MMSFVFIVALSGPSLLTANLIFKINNYIVPNCQTFMMFFIGKEN